MSLAKAFVTGVVVKAPEKRFTQNDMAIASFTINIDKTANALLRVSAFGQLADMAASAIGLNDTVAVEGRLQVNSYTLPNGKEKRVFEISANAVEKIESSPIAQTSPSVVSGQNIVSFNKEETVEELIDEDEIPF